MGYFCIHLAQAGEMAVDRILVASVTPLHVAFYQLPVFAPALMLI
jgi:hypothetical protein